MQTVNVCRAKEWDRLWTNCNDVTLWGRKHNLKTWCDFRFSRWPAFLQVRPHAGSCWLRLNLWFSNGGVLPPKGRVKINVEEMVQFEKICSTLQFGFEKRKHTYSLLTTEENTQIITSLNTLITVIWKQWRFMGPRVYSSENNVCFMKKI